MAYPLPCVLFAGGKSSRMGRDKALLPFGGFSTLAQYQYERLRPLFRSVHLSAKSDKFPFTAPLILDDSELFAPTAGLLAAFECLQGDFFALSVDTPFVDEKIVETLWTHYEHGACDAVIARSPGGSHPMCGIYTTRILPPLQKMVRMGRYRLGDLLQHSDTCFVDFDEEAPFFNMNTPEEYKAARR